MKVETLRQPELARAVPLLIAAREEGGLNADPNACERTLRDFLARGVGHLLIAGGADGPTGYLALVWGYSVAQGRPTAVVQDVYVRPDVRRQGAESALLAEAEKRARTYGAASLELSEDHADERDSDMYERAGLRRLEGRGVRVKLLD